MQYLSRLLVLALLALFCGCAIFRGDQIPPITLAPYEASGKPKPSLSYSSLALGGLGTVKQRPQSEQEAIGAELLSVLEQSGYFSRLAKSDATADIRFSSTLTSTGNPAAVVPAFITGFSLWTIPSWAKDSLELAVDVKRADGLEKHYVIQDSATIVQWLPMIFVFPFKGLSVLADVRRNMVRKVLQDMQTDGFFR